jgi:hypothetical protein
MSTECAVTSQLLRWPHERDTIQLPLCPVSACQLHLHSEAIATLVYKSHPTEPGSLPVEQRPHLQQLVLQKHPRQLVYCLAIPSHHRAHTQP